MQRHMREIIEKIEMLGITIDDIRKGTHYQLKLSKDAKRGVITVSTSCTDSRFIKNVLSDAKRVTS